MFYSPGYHTEACTMFYSLGYHTEACRCTDQAVNRCVFTLQMYLYKICVYGTRPLEHTLRARDIVSSRSGDGLPNGNRKSLERRLRSIQKSHQPPSTPKEQENKRERTCGGRSRRGEHLHGASHPTPWRTSRRCVGTSPSRGPQSSRALSRGCSRSKGGSKCR